MSSSGWGWGWGWDCSCTFVQTNGSVDGVDWGALLFSVGSDGGGGMDELGCDVVEVAASDKEPRPRCCVLLDRTKLLNAGRIVLEI
jgi:hypothetical protein